ncbi:MAG TPA: Holliday junction branch migration protein RuvA [Spirochaetia bacterium]|nr:Holliday junction branch migration protein RuvA [Spirochaetia bacterium]
MFNSVTGEITFKGDERLCVQTGGVEWDLTVSRRALDRLPPVGQVARVYTHLLHREDSMRLYGFSDPAERALFLDLQKVDGVGPRGALKVLSGVDREAFAQALDKDDVETLSSLPGIGKKTAQKIILTLKGKLTPAVEAAGRSAEDDIATALVGMGFDRRTAKSAVTAAAKSLAGKALKVEDLERELFKRAVAIAGGEPNAADDGGGQ